MLNVRRSLAARPRAPRRPGVAALWGLLALPLVVSACISVTQEVDPGASLVPSLVPSALPASPSPASLGPTLPPATPSPPATPPASPRPLASEVVGFLPSWFLESEAGTLDADLLTTVAFHGIEASGDGRLVQRKPSGDVPDGWAALEGQTFDSLKADLQAKGVRVVPVIQRFGWTADTLERTRALLTSKPDRRALAERIARLVEDRGFDGVNLDVEPVPEDLADAYVTFVREVRRALDGVAPGLHLSVDAVASLKGYDLAGLTAEGAADLVVLMGYNYRTDASATAGSTAPLRGGGGSGDLEATVREALAQAPAGKLALALPWFGSAWSTASELAGSALVSGEGIDTPASPTYAEAVTQAMVTGRQWDPEQASAWTAYPARQCSTCPAVWRQVWYDDADAFGAKMDLALGQGLAGVGVWALGQEGDREELWWALRERTEPSVDVSPPNGSASLDPETVRGDLEGRDVVEGAATLRLFASDGEDGSGLLLARVGLDDEVDADGQLVVGRTYPATERIDFPLADAATGGSPESGPRSIHVQWRDLAGNWSAPLVIEVHVLDPVASRTPEDL